MPYEIGKKYILKKHIAISGPIVVTYFGPSVSHNYSFTTMHRFGEYFLSSASAAFNVLECTPLMEALL